MSFVSKYAPKATSAARSQIRSLTSISGSSAVKFNPAYTATFTAGGTDNTSVVGGLTSSASNNVVGASQSQAGTTAFNDGDAKGSVVELEHLMGTKLWDQSNALSSHH